MIVPSTPWSISPGASDLLTALSPARSQTRPLQRAAGRPDAAPWPAAAASTCIAPWYTGMRQKGRGAGELCITYMHPNTTPLHCQIDNHEGRGGARGLLLWDLPLSLLTRSPSGAAREGPRSPNLQQGATYAQGRGPPAAAAPIAPPSRGLRLQPLRGLPKAPLMRLLHPHRSHTLPPPLQRHLAPRSQEPLAPPPRALRLPPGRSLGSRSRLGGGGGGGGGAAAVRHPMPPPRLLVLTRWGRGRGLPGLAEGRAERDSARERQEGNAPFRRK